MTASSFPSSIDATDFNYKDNKVFTGYDWFTATYGYCFGHDCNDACDDDDYGRWDTSTYAVGTACSEYTTCDDSPSGEAYTYNGIDFDLYLCLVY